MTTTRFKNWYDSNTAVMRREIKKTIMQVSDWSEDIFYDKLSGRTKMTPLEAIALAHQFNINIDEIFPCEGK